MRIAVTGGTGYIGSHVALELMHAGHDVVIVDNLSNSSEVSVQRMVELAGRAPIFYQTDIRDIQEIRSLFSRHSIEAVLHFAGLKAVGESVSDPLAYYDNNVHGSLQLLKVMRELGIRQFIFSSSATVYGQQEQHPFAEQAALGPTNPYGHSKRMVEQLLEDLCVSDPSWRVAALRYFNPAGAHPSGLMGEVPRGVPNNLMPYVLGVLTGRYEQLRVFGQDYPTPDGTGVRDYIHVMDLSSGHVAALDYLQQHAGYHVFNLGTGSGYSVLQVVESFEKVSGRKVPYTVLPRRPGDVAESFAVADKAWKAMSWRAERTLQSMCQDAWTFAQRNPDGY